MIRLVEKIDDLVPINAAFISVTDKTGLDVLVPALIKNCPHIQIISTGGTYGAIKAILGERFASMYLLEVSEYTGQPETEGGLVKSLHHKLFLGYLTETYCNAHQDDLIREEAFSIDLVVINLYPFQKVAAGNPKFEEARGNIDVGGPSALRAAAKNCLRVMTIADPLDYDSFIQQLEFYRGQTSFRQRFIGAGRTFKTLSEYDTAISDYLAGEIFETAKESYQIAHKAGN